MSLESLCDMIDVQRQDKPIECTVVDLRSNVSMTLDRLVVLFAALSGVTLLVALGPMLLGLWPIMAIAVGHLILVGWCLRLAWRGNWVRERLVIDPRRVIVEHFDAKGRTFNQWPSAWVRVEWQRGPLGDRYPALSSHGRRQAIGQFLPEQERQEVSAIVSQCLRSVTAWRLDIKHR